MHDKQFLLINTADVPFYRVFTYCLSDLQTDINGGRTFLFPMELIVNIFYSFLLKTGACN